MTSKPSSSRSDPSDLHAYNQAALELLHDQRTPGGRVQLRVVSQSMAPFLKVGDMVLVEPMASDSPAFNVRRGDVIVVRRAGELITHRLVSMGKETCLTKGDRNRFMDPPIAHQAILGKVIAVERNGRVRRLNDFPWVRLNRLFGYYGWWQARLFASTRRLWHRYFQ